MKYVLLLLLAAAVVGCKSEDPAFVAWAEHAADAQCACAKADDPHRCVLDMDPDFEFSDQNVAAKSARWKDGGGEKTSAAIRRAAGCDQEVRAWEGANPTSRKRSAAVSTTPAPQASPPKTVSPAATEFPSKQPAKQLPVVNGSPAAKPAAPPHPAPPPADQPKPAAPAPPPRANGDNMYPM